MNSSQLNICFTQLCTLLSDDDKSVSDHHGIITTSETQHLRKTPLEHDTTPSFITVAVSARIHMTVKDLKVIHAEILIKIVRSGVPRLNPRLGELFAALRRRPDFDPHNHTFRHLPDNFFLTLTQNDLDQTAWGFVTPETAAGAINTMLRNRENHTRSAQEHYNKASVIPENITAWLEKTNAAWSCRQKTIHETDHIPPIKPNKINQALDPEANNFISGGAYLQRRHPKASSESGSEHQISSDLIQRPIMEHRSERGASQVDCTSFVPNISNLPQHQILQVMMHRGSHLKRSQQQHRGISYSQTGVGTTNEEERTQYLPRPQHFAAPHASTVAPGLRESIIPIFFNHYRPGDRTTMMDVSCYAPAPSALSESMSFNPSRSHQGINRYPMFVGTLQRLVDTNVPVNPNYKGDIDDYTIQNANCPFEENCSVHVEGFSPLESLQDMLSIAHPARVAALNRRDPHPPKYPHASGDFTFFDRAAADSFMRLGERGMYSAHGFLLRIMWNKNKVRPASYEECGQSRILLITGPGTELSYARIMNVLRDKVDFVLVNSEEQYMGNDRILVRLEFSQIRGQSRQAMKCIWSLIKTNGFQNMRVDYGI